MRHTGPIKANGHRTGRSEPGTPRSRSCEKATSGPATQTSAGSPTSNVRAVGCRQATRARTEPTATTLCSDIQYIFTSAAISRAQSSTSNRFHYQGNIRIVAATPPRPRLAQDTTPRIGGKGRLHEAIVAAESVSKSPADFAKAVRIWIWRRNDSLLAQSGCGSSSNNWYSGPPWCETFRLKAAERDGFWTTVGVVARASVWRALRMLKI